MRKVVFSNEAKQHLESIKAYSLDTWGETKTEDYLQSLRSALLRAADKILPGHQHAFVTNDYRVISVQKHLIIIQYDKDTIYVYAIVHQMIDLYSYIRDMEKRVRF